MTISDHVARYVAIKQHLGYEFTTNEQILSSFARFADARDEAFFRAETALQWAATAPSRDRCVKKPAHRARLGDLVARRRHPSRGPAT